MYIFICICLFLAALGSEVVDINVEIVEVVLDGRVDDVSIGAEHGFVLEADFIVGSGSHVLLLVIDLRLVVTVAFLVLERNVSYKVTIVDNAVSSLHLLILKLLMRAGLYAILTQAAAKSLSPTRGSPNVIKVT